MANRPPSLRAPSRVPLLVGCVALVVVVVVVLVLMARAARGQTAGPGPSSLPASAVAPCVQVAQRVTLAAPPGRDPCPCAGVGLLPRAWRELFSRGPQK